MSVGRSFWAIANPEEALKFQADVGAQLSENMGIMTYNWVITVGLLVYSSIIIYGGHVCPSQLGTGLYTWSLVSWYLLLFSSACVGCALCAVAMIPKDQLQNPEAAGLMVM